MMVFGAIGKKTYDVNILDDIAPETGAFYVMDRGYIDLSGSTASPLSSAFFVVRTQTNVLLQRRCSHPGGKATSVRSDHTVILSSFQSSSVYPNRCAR
jgi:hypothetical protein